MMNKTKTEKGKEKKIDYYSVVKEYRKLYPRYSDHSKIREYVILDYFGKPLHLSEEDLGSCQLFHLADYINKKCDLPGIITLHEDLRVKVGYEIMELQKYLDHIISSVPLAERKIYTLEEYKKLVKNGKVEKHVGVGVKDIKIACLKEYGCIPSYPVCFELGIGKKGIKNETDKI